MWKESPCCNSINNQFYYVFSGCASFFLDIIFIFFQCFFYVEKHEGSFLWSSQKVVYDVCGMSFLILPSLQT